MTPSRVEDLEYICVGYESVLSVTEWYSILLFDDVLVTVLHESFLKVPLRLWYYSFNLLPFLPKSPLRTEVL